MAFTEPSELRDVHGICEDQKSQIKIFMQGAICCWIKNCEGKPFAVRDLMGGKNTDWAGTPLQVLYDKHAGAGKDDDSAVADAAKDLGWLVKRVLADDKRYIRSGQGWAGKLLPLGWQ